MQPADFAQLRALRLGNVAYLNSLPLTWGAPEAFSYEHPAHLAEELHAGRLDGALAPLYALLDPARYVLVDGLGICAHGPVYSVGVVAAAPLGELSALRLTTSSRSSRNLLKVLYSEFLPATQPAFTEATLPDLTDVDWPASLAAELATLRENPRTGLLLIGDRALAAHRYLEEVQPQGDLRFIDLAEEWRERTGLPFVFAMWGLRRELPPNVQASAAQELRALAKIGLARREEIAATQPGGVPEDFALRYLTEHIQYEVGPEEKVGITEYLRLLHKHGLLPAEAGQPAYV